tara:strand:+ start:317 stop:532 length:216 start_codon:yes stop_codon:yes gene_type:complete
MSLRSCIPSHRNISSLKSATVCKPETESVEVGAEKEEEEEDREEVGGGMTFEEMLEDRVRSCAIDDGVAEI